MSGTQTVATDDNGAVIANYQRFVAAFPQLAQTLTQDEFEAVFAEVGLLYLANNASSAVRAPATRERLLFLLVAHVALLRDPKRAGMVGRVSNASEGSVSVGTDMAGMPGSAAWFAQTQAGASYWAAVQRFALTRYVPGRRPVFDPGPVVGMPFPYPYSR